MLFIKWTLKNIVKNTVNKGVEMGYDVILYRCKDCGKVINELEYEFRFDKCEFCGSKNMEKIEAS